MSNEIFFGRFLILVLLFVLSIALLILSPNLISLLLGWDGLGVTSYLLVVFYQRNKSYNAGIITALTNRMGDVGILIRVGLIFFLGDWTFIYFRDLNKNFEGRIIIVIITLAACTKRAQIPFSSWLPAAIAAPTPVSALVHSSTLVTAGVYLLVRFNYLLANSFFRYFLIVAGILTIIIAGIAAIVEIDIKKVIALSTLRQLGVIIMVIGAQKPLLAYFHLLSHAYFKAILFICAGIIIHNIKDYQDIRTIGATGINIPIISRVINVANIRLCGLPFIRGFYSKDIILEILLLKGLNILLLLIIIFATLLTICYSCRLSFCLGANNIKLENIRLVSETDKFILGGIVILLPFAIFGGINLSWFLLSGGPLIFLPLWLKSSILILIITGIFFVLILFKNSFFIEFSFLGEILKNIWFLPLTLRKTRRYWALEFHGKSSIKISESSWLEFFFFKKIILIFKNFSFYIFSIVSNYFLRSFFIFILFNFLLN